MKSVYSGHYEMRADHWLLTGVCWECDFETRTAGIADEEDIENVEAMIRQHLTRKHGIGDRYRKGRKMVKKMRKAGKTDEQLRLWWYGERDRSGFRA